MSIKGLPNYVWIYPNKKNSYGIEVPTRTAYNPLTGNRLTVRQAQTASRGGVSYEQKKRASTPQKTTKSKKATKSQIRRDENIKLFGEKFNLTPTQVRKDKAFSQLNTEMTKGLNRKGILEKQIAARKEKGQNIDKQQAELDEVLADLGDIFRGIGRKSPEDFSPLGKTPILT